MGPQLLVEAGLRAGSEGYFAEVITIGNGAWICAGASNSCSNREGGALPTAETPTWHCQLRVSR